MIFDVKSTLDGSVAWEALEWLLEHHRLNPEDGTEGWPEDRCVYSEMCIFQGDKPIGFGRLIFDQDRDDCPRLFDLCLDPAHRSPFMLGTLEEILLNDYAISCEGGSVVQGFDGREIDLAANTRSPRGLVPRRVI